MSDFFANLLKVLSKNDNLVLAAQTSEGLRAVAKGAAAFAKSGGNLEKTANLSAVMFGGASDAIKVKLVGGTAREEGLGLFFAGLTAFSNAGSVLLGSDNSLKKVALGTAALSKLASDLVITRQIEKWTGPPAVLPGKTPTQLDPRTFDVVPEQVEDTEETPVEERRIAATSPRSRKSNTPFRAARTFSTAADLGVQMSKDESDAQKGLEMAAAAGDLVARALLGIALAESDSEYKLAIGANAAASAGAIVGIFASKNGKLKKVADVTKNVGEAVGNIQAIGQLGRKKKRALAQSGRSYRPSRRAPAAKKATRPPEGASD